MIVRIRKSETWLLAQDEHARLSGDFAALWGGEGLPAPPAEVVQAAALHDRGWREWDARPRLDAERGTPHPYTRMPGEAYRRIWAATLAEAWRAGPLQGLLASRHGMRFFARKDDEADRIFHAEQQRREREGRARLSDGQAARLDSWHAWFFFWDGLSLFCCEGWPSPWTHRLPRVGGGSVDVVVRRQPADARSAGGEVVSVAPFPFRAPFRVEAPMAIVGGTCFQDQAALDTAWAGRRRARRWWRIADGENRRR